MSPGETRWRLTVISHSMVQDSMRGRWRALARHHPVDVDLLVPSRWESVWFGQKVVHVPGAMAEDSFRVIPVPVTNRCDWGRYLLRSIDAGLRSRQPHVILVYGEEFSLVLHQMILYRRIWAAKARLAFFTWNNLAILGGRKRWLKRSLWRRVCRGTDLVIAGNNRGQELLLEADYPGPVVVQTEVGVDPETFCPDEEAALRTREALGLKGFVVGFAGRITAAKGVRDLFAALEHLTGDWSLLMVGDGDLRHELEGRACAGACRAHFTGEVKQEDMPDYIRAMDCLVLPSRSMADWHEQFGLVLVQAMACGVPVIGSDSGAIPEVIGDAGLLFHEGDAAELTTHLMRLLTLPQCRMDLGRAGLLRAVDTYSTQALARDLFQVLWPDPQPGLADHGG